MKIRALMAVAIVEASTGNLISIPHGGIAEISDELAESLINDGIAEEYTLLSPTGTVLITTSEVVDVKEYASARVVIGDTIIGQSITTAVVPDDVTYITNQAFAVCTSLVSVTISDSVTAISGLAFAGCTSLENITIGSGITAIGGWAFNKCTSLTSLTIKATTPPEINGFSFVGLPDSCTIYVPSSSVNAYKSTTWWVSHINQIQPIPTT